MNTADKIEYLTFAKSVALEAGEIMRKYFGKNPGSHLKANKTIVTVADEEINAMAIDRVKEKCPYRTPTRPPPVDLQTTAKCWNH